MLEALPSPAPGVRLRRLLKIALRAFDLRCLEIVPADAELERHADALEGT